ncbi:MAG: phospholipid transport system transporter-binding protein [Janthinobacterium sp.]|jgi:phospholipid transport system transporter-binding protein
MPDSLDPLQSMTSLTVANARTALAQGFDAISSGEMTFDLRNLEVVDSAAVSVMLAWRRQAQKTGQSLQLKNLPANLKSLTKLYGVCELMFDVPEVAATADLQQGKTDH